MAVVCLVCSSSKNRQRESEEIQNVKHALDNQIILSFMAQRGKVANKRPDLPPQIIS